MKPANSIKQSPALIPALLLVLSLVFANQANASWDYGNGRHGSFVLTTNATIEQMYQTVRLTNDPAQYNPSDSNAIPNFQNLIITNGATLTANPWDGSAGGRIVLKVEATLSIASGSSMSVSGIGYRGGGQGYQGQYATGIEGESFAGSQIPSGNANYGGGGGGTTYDVHSTYRSYSGAGGGGYGESGASVTHPFFGLLSAGGGTYGMATMETNYLGSGGGGYPLGPNANGGNGGGGIAVDTGNINVDGQIQASGADGSNGSGGGSGGSIRLRVATAVLGTNHITAVGGNGANGGGNGGAGRIMIGFARSYTGGTTPGAYILLDTNSDNVTVITNQPVTQTNFLAANVTFNVGVYGLPILTFQWNFNNVSIPGATNQSLSLNNIALTNTGNYTVTISNSVMTIVSSNAFLKVLDTAIPIADGIPNWWKLQYGFATNDATFATNHPSGDKLTYLQKYLYSLNPSTLDTDGDSLTDYDEIFIYHTNPLLADTDGDGIPDNWEIQHGLNPLVNDATQIGSAGVSNLQIYQYDLSHTNQLDPRNPFFAPGTSIYESLNNGQHTNRLYYDRDDRLVGEEFSRGLSIAYKYDGNGNPIRQTYLSRASETNGLPVLWQFLNGLTNNASIYADSDGDGWSNYQEWQAGTDPNNSQSTPSQISNPGTNIASLALPFTPSNFVVGVGQLDGSGANEIVVGADGNPGTNMNSLLVLTQTFTGWSTQRVDIGFFGVTSIAVGQLTNRPAPAIYVGLRGTTNGSGRVMELASNGGIWQSNLVVLSTNKAAFVLGLRGQDLLVSCGTTNTLDGSLSAASFSTNWNLSLMDTNSSHRGLGTLFQAQAQSTSTSALRLLDSGGIAAGTTQVSSLVSNLISYWKLDESSGNAFDSVGTNVLINNNNVIYDDGRINNGADFGSNNANKSLSNGGGFSLVANNPTSYSVWAKLNTEISSDIQSICALVMSSGKYMIIQYQYNGGARRLNYYYGRGGVNNFGNYYNVTLGTSSWHHFVFTDDGLGNINGYLDGANVISAADTGTIVSSSGFSQIFSLGTGWDSGSIDQFISAKVDEVGIWSRALSASEVNLLYGNGFGVTSLSVSEPAATSRYLWRGKSLASGIVRSGQTNTSSVFYTFGDDLNGNNILDAGDDFVIAEYSVAATNATITTLSRQRIASSATAQSYGLATANYLNQSNAVFFTGEPDGQVFAWTAIGATNPLQRQLFSSQHAGKAWHALTGIKTLEAGEGLAGLRVDPTNQNRCDVIFWSPQTQLSQIVDVPQTAPSAAVIPSANSLGSNAVVTVRLWDNEGNDSTPFLQYQILGLTNWQNATLTALDGAAYNSTTRVATLPTGVNHTLAWNAANDLGAGVNTNILLRARAQDFSLVGDWSAPTPFAVNMNQDANTNGIPDWWEMQHFGSLQPADGDIDHDGFSNYAEYIADTDPADPNSNLRLTKVQRVAGGIAIIWQGGIQSTQYLQQRFSLNPTSSWVEIFTNLPPTANPSGFTNYGLTNNAGFYRVRVTR